MKKAISLVLAMAMCFALAAPVFAEAPEKWDAISFSLSDNDYFVSSESESFYQYNLSGSTLSDPVKLPYYYISPDTKITVKNANPDYTLSVYLETFRIDPEATETYVAQYDEDFNLISSEKVDLSKNYVSYRWPVVAEELYNFLAKDGKWNDVVTESGYIEQRYTFDMFDGTSEMLTLPNEITFTAPENVYSENIYRLYMSVYDKATDRSWWTYFHFRVDGEKVAEYTAPVAGFTDVQQGRYYAPAVKWAVDNGITNGTSKTTFSPNATLTRAQAVTFLWRASGKPEAQSKENPFKDVKEGSFYYDAVLWARENNITNGISADEFGVDGNVTRAQMITFLWRTEGKPNDIGGEWYEAAENWARDNDLLSGTAKDYETTADCPRADVVYYLYKDMAE